MRRQIWDSGGLVSDNIGTLDTTELRQEKYDEIRAEMDSRIAIVDASMQEEQDAFATGAELNPDKIDALVQQRHDLRRVKGPAVRVAVDLLGDDNEAIHGFKVKEEFNKL